MSSIMSAARAGPIPRKLESRSTTFIRASIRPRSSGDLRVTEHLGDRDAAVGEPGTHLGADLARLNAAGSGSSPVLR